MAQTGSQKEQKVLEALYENWQAEMLGFHTYNTLSDRDDDPVRRKTLRHMAEAEAHHAALWAKRIRELTVMSRTPGVCERATTAEAESRAVTPLISGNRRWTCPPS